MLDSTPLYDAVATMDTVTLVRTAIRACWRCASGALGAGARGARPRRRLPHGGKPAGDYDDPHARAALIDALAEDVLAAFNPSQGRLLRPLGAGGDADRAVVGQDLEDGADGDIRIARRVAKDRIITTVDPDARHGHKTTARGFDGYKGHVAVDPDPELITAMTVTAGNAGDGSSRRRTARRRAGHPGRGATGRGVARRAA